MKRKRNCITRDDLTADMARERLDYNPDTGVMTWKDSPFNRRKPGTVAGSMNSKGYRVIRIFHCTYPTHRLAWLLVHGAWPLRFLDHKDGDKSNNTLSNLREATDSQNQLNSPHRGYNFEASSGLYRSRVTVDGKRISLGRFKTAEQAHAAYIAAHVSFHGEFSHANRSATSGEELSLGSRTGSLASKIINSTALRVAANNGIQVSSSDISNP